MIGGYSVAHAQTATPGGSVIANPATATTAVRAARDSTFDCPDVVGKVFDDRNTNGYPDPGERGIADVRLATVRGLSVSTDADGRFHIPCPEMPNANRGGSFVMKLDVNSLPLGYRMTTANQRDLRLTRGRAAEIGFGATLFREVRVAIGDAAFETGSVNLLPQWQQQIDALPRSLLARPSTVNIAYQPGKDSTQLVRQRIEALRDALEQHWKALPAQYELSIEVE